MKQTIFDKKEFNDILWFWLVVPYFSPKRLMLEMIFKALLVFVLLSCVVLIDVIYPKS